MSHTRLSNKEVAAFHFISEMCRGYDYFDDVDKNDVEERVVMSDHDIEADNDYSHNLKLSMCNYLEDEGIIDRKKEDDGFFICKQDFFIKYVVRHMATKAWPKKELLKYGIHYCKGEEMGKRLIEEGQSLPVRTIYGDCMALEGSSYQIAHVPYKVKNAFPPGFARLHLLPMTLRKRKCPMDVDERADFRDDAIRVYNDILMWKQNYRDKMDEMVDTKFVLLRKKVSYEVVSPINDMDHFQCLVGAIERSSKKRPLCDKEPPAAKKKASIESTPLN